MTIKSGLLGGRRSIRYPILAIAWIPSLVLLLIGLLVAGGLAYQGGQTRAYNDRFNGASRTAAGFMTMVFTERRLSESAVANPGGGDSAELVETRGKVDAALPPFLADVRALRASYPQAYSSTVDYLAALPPRLAQLRQRVSSGQAKLVDVAEFYSDITRHVIDNLFASASTQPVAKAAAEATLGVTLLRATDDLLDADALAVAAFTSENGLSDEEFALLVRREGSARARFAEVGPLLPPSERAAFEALTRTTAWKQIEQAHAAALLTRGGSADGADTAADRTTRPRRGADRTDRIAGADATREVGRGTRPAPPLDPRVWGQSTGKVVGGVTAINLQHSAYAASLSTEQGEAQIRQAMFIGAGLIITAVIVFLLTTFTSNRIVRRLQRLRSETLVLSNERLPSIVGRLRDGKAVDVGAELPPLQFGRDEIGQVAEAFDQAQRTAVAAAAREAETRAGLRTVFLDIAHRSQAIVHRQLKVLDQAERAQEDPDQLALLFQLDHLSTRARRNAENLIILGGGQAGRQWRNPVPLIEITRSAISEAEDYVRVQIAGLPRVTLQGAAVADVIHLLAELVDNATNFSPPMSRVEVRGNLVGRGVVLEVEDQGLGIEPEQMEHLNLMLHEPPDFQVMAIADEPRLGLFVVAQLAHRHGIRVTITPSPAYGGTRVVVLLPSSLIAGDPALDAPRREHPGLSSTRGWGEETPPTPSRGTPRGLDLLPGLAGLPGLPEPGAPAPTPTNGVGRHLGSAPSLDAAMVAPELFVTGPAGGDDGRTADDDLAGTAPSGLAAPLPLQPLSPRNGLPPFGRSPLGQDPFGQAPLGQDPFGQAPLGQDPFGQAPLGQDPFGPPPGVYGQPVVGPQASSPLQSGPQRVSPPPPPVRGETASPAPAAAPIAADPPAADPSAADPPSADPPVADPLTAGPVDLGDVDGREAAPDDAAEQPVEVASQADPDGEAVDLSATGPRPVLPQSVTHQRFTPAAGSSLAAGSPPAPGQPPEPGLFGAPLRDTGLFEPPVREAGVVDLRPFDAVDQPSQPGARTAAGATSAAASSGAASSGAASSGSTASDATPGRGVPVPGNSRPDLPRRVRQTHLSPRLRDLPAEEVEPEEPAVELPDAELARSRMSALQRGTQRGRASDPEA